MKRLRIWPFATAIALLTLLPLLAYLQYRWQGQVSQALRAQLQEQMRRAAGQFAEDFDREIGRIYTTFQTSLPEAKTAESRAEQLRLRFSELYSHWAETAPYPKLVSDL